MANAEFIPSVSLSKQNLYRLSDITSNCCTKNNITFKTISICQNRRDRSGDFIVPKGSTTEISKTVLSEIESKLTEEPLSFKYDSVSSDQFNSVIFHLQRSSTFQCVIEDTLSQADNYGKSLQPQDNLIMLNSQCYMEEEDSVASQKNVGCEFIRNIVTLQHIQRLLEANGYEVKMVPVVSKPCHTTKQMYELFNFPVSGLPSSTDIDLMVDHDINCLIKSEYCEEVSHQVNIETAPNHEHHKARIFDLCKFIQDQVLASGSSVYNKNLSYVNITTNEGVSEEVRKVSFLKTCVKDFHQKQFHIIHVINTRQAFNQQQIALLFCHLLRSKPITQSQFLYGDVTGRISDDKPSYMSCSQLYQLRFAQVKESSKLKYGDAVEGEDWYDILLPLTIAGIRFEMLTTSARNVLKLDLQDNLDGHGTDTRAGSFVMYNCARLATLLRHYQDAVNKGLYPQLPDIKNVDFETLREEEEWKLLLDYVLIFPDVVYSCVKDFKIKPNEDICAKIQIHKITSFLVGFSRSLSSYYSKFHILGDTETHLVKKMFARIYLMKAAHQVLQNGLKLLDIVPPKQL